MKTFVPTLFASTALLLAPMRAWPEEDTVAQKPQTQTAAPQAAPAERPPAPPAEAPPPPVGPEKEARPAPEPPATPSGQWVYTQQYGWVWAPYGSQYSTEGTGGTYVYVYYPAVGWTWLVSPFAWDWWPWPYYRPYGYWGSYWPWGHRWFGPRYGPGWRGYPWPGHRGTWPAPPRAMPAPRPGGRR
jgi:hypothetical protein